MKIKIKNYVFTPAAKTVVFSDYTSIKLDNIILITDVKTGTTIYNFAAANLTGAVSGNTLTVNYDTTGLTATNLAIYYDDPGSTQSTDETIILLRRMVKLLEPIATQDILQRQKVTVDAITGGLTLATVSSVSSVANIIALGSVDARFHFIDLARTAYATGIRAKLI
jgi:hypothetical protein